MRVRQRVRAGASALNALVPDWRTRMPVDNLQLGVILPAAFGTKDEAIEKLGQYVEGTLSLARLGFEVTANSHNAYAEARSLASAWAEVIAPP